MVERILVATDGSNASDMALEYAVEMAKMYDGEILLLNVIRPDVITTYRQMDREAVRKKVMEEREDTSKRILGKSVSRAEKLGVNAESVTRRGAPDEEIVNFAKARDDIVMMVMGAFGKNFLERQIVGSKTEGVLRAITELDMPLVVVPHPCKMCRTDVPRKILVATDGSEASEAALGYAVEITKKYEGELLIMNVIKKGIREGISSKKEKREEDSKKIIDKSVKIAKEAHIQAKGIVKRGLVDKEIVKFAKERDDMALLVMGAYGKNFLERQLVGSKTQGVLRKIPELDVPLAVVPVSIKKQNS